MVKEVKVVTVYDTEVPSIKMTSPIEVREAWDKLVLNAPWYDAEKENVVSFILNTQSRLKYFHLVSVGDVSSSIVHPREIFRAAIRCAGSSIIIAHNHPSGDQSPSTDDTRVTRILREAGELLDIKVLDHIIVGVGTFSMVEAGMM